MNSSHTTVRDYLTRVGPGTRRADFYVYLMRIFRESLDVLSEQFRDTHPDIDRSNILYHMPLEVLAEVIRLSQAES